jgi:hypothetical protein
MMRTSAAFLGVFCVALGLGTPSPGAGDDKSLEALRGLKVEPTREGVEQFLAAVAKGDHGPLGAREADALIARLGHDDFEQREAATNQLASMLFPPLGKLQEATRHKDAEVAARSRRVLDRLASRTDPVAALFRVARDKAIPLAPSQVMPVIARCESAAGLEAAEEALVAAVKPADRELLRKWVGDKEPRVKAAALLGLGAALKDDAVPELRKHLEGGDETVRSAAARALAQRGQVFDYKKYAPQLDAETRVTLLRAAERRFRQENKDRRDKPGVMDQYGKLLDDYAVALAKAKGVKQEKKAPQKTPYWLELGMSTSKHPEVLMYKIRWFGGQWSSWYVPGFNDKLTDGRAIRFWSCFNDHEYEVITTTEKRRYRETQDLP